jgi:hypothetical protein
MDPNTAVSIRGCFIGIPGKRQPRPVPKGDMHLAEVVTDLHFVSSAWWRSKSRPEIANSDRSVWGMLNVRHGSLSACSSVLSALALRLVLMMLRIMTARHPE